ncbi:hypothetical protein E1A91_D03G154100v1 [Gossypium mustelinum]|uniref:Uncharacterized protein n=1 Tax=Gossypium mustelinum TaxID=34275 RepID=A0A5D2VN32_GOSMU|nr:hypothetical protein E1A91_D03G154100v1 [Gossypium mustelinum]
MVILWTMMLVDVSLLVVEKVSFLEVGSLKFLGGEDGIIGDFKGVDIGGGEFVGDGKDEFLRGEGGRKFLGGGNGIIGDVKGVDIGGDVFVGDGCEFFGSRVGGKGDVTRGEFLGGVGRDGGEGDVTSGDVVRGEFVSGKRDEFLGGGGVTSLLEVDMVM